jgi:hypothetical protein
MMEKRKSPTHRFFNNLGFTDKRSNFEFINFHHFSGQNIENLSSNI